MTWRLGDCPAPTYDRPMPAHALLDTISALGSRALVSRLIEWSSEQSTTINNYQSRRSTSPSADSPSLSNRPETEIATIQLSIKDCRAAPCLAVPASRIPPPNSNVYPRARAARTAKSTNIVHTGQTARALRGLRTARGAERPDTPLSLRVITVATDVAVAYRPARCGSHARACPLPVFWAHRAFPDARRRVRQGSPPVAAPETKRSGGQQ